MADAVIDFYRSLIERTPDCAALHTHLAQALLDFGDIKGAFWAASEAINRDAELGEAWLVRAASAQRTGDWQSAAHDYERADQLVPDRVAVLVNTATCYAELDRLIDAERLLRRAISIEPGNKEAQANLGSILVKLDRLTEAEEPCRAALALDPTMISVHQNLSGILLQTSPVESKHHRDLAYQQQQVFIEPAIQESARVLVLSAADAANVPLRHLMPNTCFTLIRWYIEYATPGQELDLPSYDLVFNSIGDADLAPDFPCSVVALLQTPGLRVLNRPERVTRTSRCELPLLLSGIDNAVVPRAIRITRSEAVSTSAVAEGLSFPVLFRPIGSHGGQGIRKVDEASAMAAMVGSEFYATEFVDFKSADGWFRKYRVIFVKGRPFPYHLAIASDWLVHYWTAGMEGDPVRRAEEQQFLHSPEAAIGTRAMVALAEIGERLGLDYGGIDFSILPDGRLLVFEANATMLVHTEQDEILAYRNFAVRAIQDAFRKMIKEPVETA